MDYTKFEPLLGSWGEHLRPFIESKECDEIYAKLKADSSKGITICPNSADTYRVFATTPFKRTKVVFMLQDPYPWVKNGRVLADGIAMSCRNTGIIQPSLEKFYEAIEDTQPNGSELKKYRKADLAHLSLQGCMMLNTALTVEKDKPSSHSLLWRPFTKFLLEDTFARFKEEVIFVLCGAESQYFEKFINPLQHRIFKLEHPANAARKLRKWEHDNIFNKINKLLQSYGKDPIVWSDDLPFRKV